MNIWIFMDKKGEKIAKSRKVFLSRICWVLSAERRGKLLLLFLVYILHHHEIWIQFLGELLFFTRPDLFYHSF